MDHHSFLQKIFPTQGSNPGLLHCKQILYCLSWECDQGILLVEPMGRDFDLLREVREDSPGLKRNESWLGDEKGAELPSRRNSTCKSPVAAGYRARAGREGSQSGWCQREDYKAWNWSHRQGSDLKLWLYSKSDREPLIPFWEESLSDLYM